MGVSLQHKNRSPSTRGKSLIFFSYTFLEITKKSHTKITKSQKNHIQMDQKSQIIEKLLKNRKKKSLKITKITKNHRKKSCDSKITQITYAILRSDLPLALQRLQNRAQSIIERAKIKDQWSGDWLTLEQLINFDRSVMTYKMMNKICPLGYTGCPKKKYPDLVDPSDKNIA